MTKLRHQVSRVPHVPRAARDEDPLSGRRMLPSVSVVIPAFDEEGIVGLEVEKIAQVLRAEHVEHEIIIVDDGSRDRTAERAYEAGARVVHHPENRGYGAALKTGIRMSRYDTIVITDADDTYPVDAIPDLLALAGRYDMVVGARRYTSAREPLSRRIAKWILKRLASFLAGRPIPDLNSGLRVMRKSVVERFEPILPTGFSFTTTITLAMLCNDYLVHYHPIDYVPRGRGSKIRPRHAYDFFLLILRTIVCFNPLKVFLPLGAILFVTAVLKLAYDLTMRNLSESAVLGFLGAIMIWALGLLADQISKIGLGPRSR